MKNNKDQYGRIVPNDLVLLPHILITLLTEKQLRKLDLINWYSFKVGGPIFVSAVALEQAIGNTNAYNEIDFCAAAELGYDQITIHWLKIDDCLHRYNEIDGFYHA